MLSKDLRSVQENGVEAVLERWAKSLEAAKDKMPHCNGYDANIGEPFNHRVEENTTNKKMGLECHNEY